MSGIFLTFINRCQSIRVITPAFIIMTQWNKTWADITQSLYVVEHAVSSLKVGMPPSLSTHRTSAIPTDGRPVSVALYVMDG